MKERHTSRRRACHAIPAALAIAFLGIAATSAAVERRPDRTTTPPDPATTVAPAASAADPTLEAAVDRLRHAVAAAPPSPALGRGFEGLDMVLLARTAEGHVRALSAPPGQAFPLPKGVGGDAAAAGFLAKHALAFGVAKPDVRFLAQRAKTVGNRRVIRLKQEFRAIPVFAAAALVQIGPGGVEFVLADLARDPADLHAPDFDTTPSTAKGTAESVALALAGEAQSAPDLLVDEPELMIFEPSVIGEAGPSQLVWRVRVRSNEANVDQLVLVDAHTGLAAFHFSQIKDLKNREIWDYNNSTSGSIVRTEGQGATAVTDVNYAYDYLGDTYDFFFTRFGRDSLDGAGMKLIGKVRYCPSPTSCPWQNASWNGVEMKFGAGFAAADDVVAHELTHGVTENESDLIYWNESGAINEALSDIFGELVDLTNTGGTDTTAVRWKMGEDVPGSGAIRDMSNPPLFGDPDRRMTSTLWWWGTSDNRGVHSNSGIANKLAYLLTDGGTFNGYTVAAQGITKTAALFYEAEANLLVTGSDYFDLYYALRRAAINLGWSPDARAAVERACRAVEIAVPTSVTTIVTDDFESGLGRWAVSGAAGVQWGLSTYRKSGGSNSAWCAAGGTSPAPAGGPYKASMDTWMQYGPFSLAGATQAWFEYDLWLQTETNYDKLGVYVSTNGTNWYGYTMHGSSLGATSTGWVRELTDMRDFERLFSSSGLVVTGQPQVWIAFRFTSDSSAQYEGVYLDNLALYKGGGAPPFGSFDTPVHGTTGVTGSIAVTGWSLDDWETTKVEVWRDPIPAEGSNPIYIGDATFVAGARSDVDAAYSTYPYSYRAGWGYMLLTNFLPAGGNGTTVLRAYAKDASQTTLLGTKTITCSNATAVKPFGAIDTPGQGQTVSGSAYRNWGWTLTPQTAFIPTNGSTIQVYIDGVPFGNPIYNLYRVDIATLFPGYANSSGAVGYRDLDTTTLSNGIHTIYWIVYDNQGRGDGVGSRYFWVQN